ncbi:DNA-directed RNA polymerases I, II, and III subunit RPABC2 [Cucumispora dikerogammari]|nr:DNA-directed RNA polymerases I, II, and III subunit RPABC2 [Cucumispora dikerogammari]
MSSEYEHSSATELDSDSSSFSISFTAEQQHLIATTPATDRITAPLMTKYEKAHILGVRAMQISKNSPIFTDIGDLTDPLKIAMKELKEGKIPFIVKRRMPDGSYERWKINELQIDDD